MLIDSPGMMLVAVCAGLFAAFIHGSVGFGFAMVATPLLALVTDIQTAILLTLIPTILVNFISIASEGHVLAAFHRYWVLGLLAMAGSGIGTQILIFSDSEIFKAVLGSAIILYLFADRIKLDLGWIQRYPRASLGLFGVSAGILAGLTNVMAPVLIIYSLEARYTRGEFIQATNVCFLLGKAIQLTLFSSQGEVTVAEMTISGLMSVTVLVSLYAGVRLRNKIQVNVYKKMLRALLLVLAGVLFLQVLY